MPDSAQLNPWLRVARQIVASIIFVVSFTFLAFQSGFPWWYWLCIGCFVIGTVIDCCRKISSRQEAEQGPKSKRAEHGSDGALDQTSKSRSRLAWQLAVGIFYLAMVSTLLAKFTDGSFWIVFAAVVSGAVFTGTVILTWATLWALRQDTRKNQVSIQTLLFLMTVVGAYLGVVRLLADLGGDRLGAGSASLLSVAVFCLVLTVLSLPVMVLIMESLVWFAAWLVRGPWIQRWLKTAHSTRAFPSRVKEEEEDRL